MLQGDLSMEELLQITPSLSRAILAPNVPRFCLFLSLRTAFATENSRAPKGPNQSRCVTNSDQNPFESEIMKRRPEGNTRERPKIRSSSVRGFNGVRSYPETKDVIGAKRVKFTDPEFDCPPNSRPNASFVQHDATGSPGSNAPKTSEYAFFKKLRKDAGSCCRSYPLHKEDNQSKESEQSGCTTEITNIFKDNCEKARSITNNVSFSSRAYALKNSGTEYLDEKVFSGKREKLRQWVAETSLPEFKELCSEGCDLVSVLLNRLVPDSNENIYCRNEKPTQMRADTKNSSHACPESKIYDKECHWTQKRDITEAKQGWYLDDFCNITRERIHSELDTKGSDSPPVSYAAKNNFQYESKKVGSESDYEGGNACLITLRDAYFGSNFENYGSTVSTCIEELNEFLDLDDSATGRRPCTLLLGWDFDNLKDEGDLAITTCNAETNLHSTLATSWDHHQQSLDGSFDACELYSSSFSNYPSKLTSLPHPHSANLHNWSMGRFLEEDKSLVAELKHFPLSLPCTPKYLNLREDCNIYNSCEGSNTVTPQSHQWVMNKVFSEKHHSDLEPLVLPSRLGFDLGWKCLSMSGSFGELRLSTYDSFQSPQKEGPCSYLLMEDEQEDCLYSSNQRQTISHLAEDTLDSHEWSFTNFQIPLDKEMYHPLLLDSSSWLRFEEDMHYDDDLPRHFSFAPVL